MRSISSLVIAGLLLPWLATTARSFEPQPTASSPSTERQSEGNTDDADDLDFSGTGRPGQQTAGESRSQCDHSSEPIQAMLPLSNSGRTILGHPNFWVYFPPSTRENTKVEFVVQNSQREDIWRSHSTLDNRLSYQSFSLPAAEPPLQTARWYRWYVKLYCGDRTASSQYVQGWVYRVSPSAKLQHELYQDQQPSHLTYAQHSIWYEAISDLLTSYHRHPQDLTLERHWQALTQAPGVLLNDIPSLGEATARQPKP